MCERVRGRTADGDPDKRDLDDSQCVIVPGHVLFVFWVRRRGAEVRWRRTAEVFRICIDRCAEPDEYQKEPRTVASPSTHREMSEFRAKEVISCNVPWQRDFIVSTE